MEREAVKGPSGRARKSRLVNRVDEGVGCPLFFFKEDGRSNGTTSFALCSSLPDRLDSRRLSRPKCRGLVILMALIENIPWRRI